MRKSVPAPLEVFSERCGGGAVLWLLLLLPREAGVGFKLGGCLDNLEARTFLGKGIYSKEI